MGAGYGNTCNNFIEVVNTPTAHLCFGGTIMKDQTTTSASVNFHGTQIITLEKDGVQYVAVRPICEGLGIKWTNQAKIIKKDPVLESTVIQLITVAKDGKKRESVCLPLQYLNGWLFKISPTRYKKDDPRRETIIQYQKECYQVLYDYWHHGQAVHDQTTKQTQAPRVNHESRFEMSRQELVESVKINDWSAPANRIEIDKNEYIRLLKTQVRHADQATRMVLRWESDRKKEANSLKAKIEEIRDSVDTKVRQTRSDRDMFWSQALYRSKKEIDELKKRIKG